MTTDDPSRYVSKVLILILALILFVSLLLAGIIAIYIKKIGPEAEASMIMSGLGALSTVILASVTVYSVIQTEREVGIKEREEKKPIVKDELSEIIEPSIRSIENNLEAFEEAEGPFAFEWVYVRGPAIYSGTRGPESVLHTSDVNALVGVTEENPELRALLDQHDHLVQEMARLGDQLYENIRPEVRNRLNSYGFQDTADHEKVLVSSAVGRVDSFGESHELYEFWEECGDDLINYAYSEEAELVQTLQQTEEEYKQLCEETLRELYDYRVKLQREYGISTEDIGTNSDDRIV